MDWWGSDKNHNEISFLREIKLFLIYPQLLLFYSGWSVVRCTQTNWAQTQFGRWTKTIICGLKAYVNRCMYEVVADSFTHQS